MLLEREGARSPGEGDMNKGTRIWTSIRRWLAHTLIRHCYWLERSELRFWDWAIGYRFYWHWYGRIFRLAHRLYPWPPGEPKDPIGFNALETELCWQGIEDQRT